MLPIHERFHKAKREFPGSLILFKVGDFYELFYEDAEVAAKSLGLRLTTRNAKDVEPMPMAGFPYHALAGYKAKLVNLGFPVEVIE